MKSFLTSPMGIRLRSIARETGINRLVAPLLRLRGYERKFSDYLLGEVREGDCVWDVGANLGAYTTRFAEKIGTSGRVVAFEPSISTFQRLRRACQGRENVVLENMALGSSVGEMGFIETDDPTGETHRLSRSGEHATHVVRVVSADAYLQEHPEFAPNVMKIDVEGFEDKVLDGMVNMLAHPQLRAIFLEVHFREFASRGHPQGPQEVAETLTRGGFKVVWIDVSHIQASRRK